MLTITYTVNTRRVFPIRLCRAMYAQSMMLLCAMLHLKYRLRKRIRC